MLVNRCLDAYTNTWDMPHALVAWGGQQHSGVSQDAHAFGCLHLHLGQKHEAKGIIMRLAGFGGLGEGGRGVGKGRRGKGGKEGGSPGRAGREQREQEVTQADGEKAGDGDIYSERKKGVGGDKEGGEVKSGEGG